MIVDQIAELTHAGLSTGYHSAAKTNLDYDRGIP
jgi:hypothetical protein